VSNFGGNWCQADYQRDSILLSAALHRGCWGTGAGAKLASLVELD